MQLHLRRSQEEETGIFGGHRGVRFGLTYKLDLTEEEKELISRYKLGEYTIYVYRRRADSDGIDITVSDIIKGGGLSFGSLDAAVEMEEALKRGAGHLKERLKETKGFDGEETIEL